MLILTRRIGEVLTVGSAVTIRIVSIKNKQIRLGIEAPKHIEVHRLEVFKRIQQERVRCTRTESVGQADVM